MIDNVTIKNYWDRITKHITPEFLGNIYHAKIMGRNDYTFMLYNPVNTTSSFLTVVCPHINSAENPKYFEITGSLRTWWYGDKSVKDFSKPDFEAAKNLLFDILEVPQKERKYFIISKIEIGMNIPVKVPCSEIINKIIGYKSNCYSRNSYAGTGIVYETKRYKKFIKMYDKVEEISKKFKKNKIKSFEEEQFLKDYGDKNILRIEFTIGGGQARINEVLGFNNLEDCIIHFNELFYFFWTQLQYIKYNNIDDDISIDDVIYGTYKDSVMRLARFGLAKLGNERVDRKIKQTKDYNMKRKLKKLYESPLEKVCSYNIRSFMIDIRNQMLYSLYKSRCLFLVKKLSLILRKPAA